MIRSPGGRAHFRSKAEFECEMDRIEVEVRHVASGLMHLNLDAVFATAGYVCNDEGDFIEVDSGACVRHPEPQRC